MTEPAGALVAGPVDSSAGAGSLENDAHKWWALAVLLLAQVMIILDIAIVNVALPSAQADLHVAASDTQWILTAYLLPFGGLLLFGGRLADYSGRKRVFCVATVGFALASAMAGAASSAGMLFAARALQGLFAAAMAPSLLSMLTLGFPRGSDRNVAFSLYAAVGAAGGALGLVLGGLLTEYLSWRWSLLINVPISLIVVSGAVPLLRESRTAINGRYDIVGGALASLGLFAVIYGIADAAKHGWGSTRTLAPLLCGIAFLSTFLVWENRVDNPLLPLAILRVRTRAAGLLAVGSAYGSPIGMVLLTLVFLQGPRHESPLTAGLQFMPVPIFGVVAAIAALRLMPRMPPRIMLLAGSILSAGGIALMTTLDARASFATHILPSLALLGFGAATLYLAGNTIALTDVPDGDSGVISALLNTTQQVSAAVGVAILATVAASSTSRYLSHHGRSSIDRAIVHGNNTSFIVGAMLMLAVAALCALVIPRSQRAPNSRPQPARSHNNHAPTIPTRRSSTAGSHQNTGSSR